MRENRSHNKKRKAAAILAIILVLAMLFSIIAPFLHSAYGATAEMTSKQGDIGRNLLVKNNQDITLSAEVGFDQNLIVGKTVPFRLVFTNTGEDFQGEVQVQIYTYKESEENTGIYSIYYQPIELPKGSSKQVVMDINVNFIHSPIKIGLVDEKGVEFYSKMIPVSYSDPETIAVGVLTENKNDLQYLKNLKLSSVLESQSRTLASGVNYDMTVFLNQNNFPVTKEVMDNFKIIIINDFDTSTLSQEQKNALDKWIKAGGLLVLGTGPNVNKILKGLDEIVSAEIGETKQIGSFPVFNDILGTNVAQYGAMEVTELMVKDAEDVLSEDNTTISVAVQNGNGKILLHSFDLAMSPFPQASGMAELLKNVYIYELPEQVLNGMDYSNQYYNLRWTSNNIPPLKTKSIQLIFCLIFLYILILGPVLYFVLKKKDKREWGWAAIPVLSIIATGMLFLFSMGSPYKNSIISTISLIQIEDGSDIGAATTFASMKSPKSGTIKFASEDKIALQENNFGGGYSYWNVQQKKDEMSQKILCGEGTEVSYFDNEKWGSNNFTFESQVDLDGSLEGVFSLNGNKLIGTIKNNMNVDLEDIVLVFGRQYLKFDGIESKQELTIEEPIAVSLYDPNNRQSMYSYSPYNSIYELFEWDSLRQKIKNKEITAERAHILGKRRDILQSIIQENFIIDKLEIPVQMYAFSNKKLFSEKFTVNEEQPLEINEAVFLKTVPISLSGVEQFDIPFGFLMPNRMENEDGHAISNVYGDYVYLDKGNSLTCIYTFPTDLNIEVFQFQWRDIYNVIGEKSIYHAASGEWEPLTEGEYTEFSEYLDENGELKISGQLPENEEVDIPLIRIKGGK